MSHQPLIVLLTDFGTADTFIGVMKGVIASICRNAHVIDLTHAITPQQVREGAFHLERSLDFFPAGTIFVCVVDPGVGTSRRPIGVDTGRFRFVAPDNGLLTPVFERFPDARCHLLSEPCYHLPSTSATFHGRDIFSPVAAHLATGVPMDKTGPAVDISSCAKIPLYRPEPLNDGTGWQGEVISIDHFGNVITSFDASILPPKGTCSVSAGNATDLPLVRTYGDVAPGKPLAYVGSSGMIEIAVRNGNASNELQIADDTPILFFVEQ